MYSISSSLSPRTIGLPLSYNALFAKASRRITVPLAIAFGCLLWPSCGPTPTVKPTESATTANTVNKETDTKRYPLTGKVVSIDKAARSINVDGDEIPGFMAAMTMPYQVRDAGVLDKLSPGDHIKAEIVMGNDGAYLENIAPAHQAQPAGPRK
jgi:protein SCO1/2